jgi:hypothetical protein
VGVRRYPAVPCGFTAALPRRTAFAFSGKRAYGRARASGREYRIVLLGTPDKARDLKSRYIDLLMKSILGMIHKDDNYNEQTRMEGLDWPTRAHSMIGWKRLDNVRELTEAVVNEGIPGDFIETGVWRGGACILMRGILAAYGIEDRSVYLADSFQGLPPPNKEQFPMDTTLNLHEHACLAVSMEQVKANFELYGLLDHNAQVIKGWFKDTLPLLGDSRFAVIRLDGDYYESTIQGLNALYPLLSPGGFIIVDDYGIIEPCRRATQDYRSEHSIQVPIQRIDTAGIWWRKPRQRAA